MQNNYLTLEEIKEVELGILIKFDRFCRDNDLTYMLTYGTLLGAVRHKGFIPWDDDIDVMMPRVDYEKFINLMLTGKEIYGTELLSRRNPYYYYPFVKLSDMSTVAKMENNKTPHGLWIDIFPIDSVPDDKKKAEKFHRKFIRLRSLVISYTTDFKSGKATGKNLLKLFLKALVRLIGINNLCRYIENESIKYNDTNCHKASSVCWQRVTGGNLDLDCYLNPVEIEFENKQFFAPQNYEIYLSSLFGNYMELPPENKRITHFLKVEYKQKKNYERSNLN